MPKCNKCKLYINRKSPGLRCAGQRDQVLSSYKSKRAGQSGLNIPGVSPRLYINEHLTINNKILFREARLRAKESSFRYVWIKDGKIFVRKDENSRIIHIQDINDIKF